MWAPTLKVMRWTDVIIHVPRWSKRQSGLIAPTEVSRPVVPESGEELPAELSPPKPDLFVIGSLPSSFEQMRVFIDEDGLKLSQSTPDELREMASNLSFETCMVALGQLAAHIAHLRGDTEAQVQLAQSVFGDPRLVARIRRLAREVGGNLEVFAEQHITSLQRLLVLHAKSVPFGQHDPAEQRVFNRAFVATSCLTARDNLDSVSDPDNRARWLAYLIQNGTYNRVEGSLESMTRHQVLLQDLPCEAEFRAHPDYCDVDQWLANDLGFTLSEQFALGFGVFAGAKPLDESLPPQQRSLLAPQFLPDLAARLGRDPERALDLLSGDREWYRKEFTRGEQTTARAAWERVAFEIRPLLRLADGRLLLISPRAVESWLGDGFYHRSLEAARRRNQVGRFQRFYGALVEHYARRILRHAHPDPRPPGAGRVFGDQPYGRRGGKKSPDIAVDCGLDLVLFEVTSGRFTLRTLLEGSADAALKDLGRLLFEKGDQLSRRINDLLAGEWAPPDVEIENVKRIWPVIITADVLQNELLWDEISERLQGKLDQPKVQPLTLLDLPDLEQLAALVEKGHGLADLISRKARGLYAQLDFRRFVWETPDLPSEVRLSMLEARWKEGVLAAANALGFAMDREHVASVLRSETEG